MSTTMKHGAMSWDAGGGSGEEGRTNSRDLYLKLSPGSNVVRILTVPYQYYQHKYKFKGEKGFGHRIYCSAKHGFCPVCAEQDKPKRRWLVGVIDRKTNTYKVLDIGYSVYKDILTYNRDSDWGDPANYDIDIVVDPNGGATNYYSVVAKPQKPLSAGDILLKDSMDLDFLARQTTPPEPSKVEEKMRKLMAEFVKDGGSLPEQREVNVASGMKPSSATAVDDEEDFPDFDKQMPF